MSQGGDDDTGELYRVLTVCGCGYVTGLLCSYLVLFVRDRLRPKSLSLFVLLMGGLLDVVCFVSPSFLLFALFEGSYLADNTLIALECLFLGTGLLFHGLAFFVSEWFLAFGFTAHACIDTYLQRSVYGRSYLPADYSFFILALNMSLAVFVCSRLQLEDNLGSSPPDHEVRKPPLASKTRKRKVQ